MKVSENLRCHCSLFFTYVQVYWSSKDQITICSSIAEMPKLTTKLTPEEWFTKGNELVSELRVVVHPIIIVPQDV
jgi:hypothetical protein